MAEKRPENSVLFSLKELRNIEDDRVREEDAQKQARLEAERQAKLELERQAREAEAAKIREAEEKIAREQKEREQHEREGKLRLQESETRAQIEASERLERARIEAEARAKIESKPFPTGKVVGGLVVLLLAVGAGVYGLVQSHNRELAHQQYEAQEQLKAERLALEEKAAAEKATLMADITKLTNELANATDDAKRKALTAQLEVKRRQAGIKESAPAVVTPPSTPHMDTTTADPLGGLDVDKGKTKASRGGGKHNAAVAKPAKGGKPAKAAPSKGASPDVNLPGF